MKVSLPEILASKGKRWMTLALLAFFTAFLLMALVTSLTNLSGTAVEGAIVFAQDNGATPEPAQASGSESVDLWANPELSAVRRCDAERAALLAERLMRDSGFLAANPELMSHCRCLRELQGAQETVQTQTAVPAGVDTTPLCQCLEILTAQCCETELAAAMAEQIMHDSAYLAANPELKCHCRCTAERKAAIMAAIRDAVREKLGAGSEPFIAELEKLTAERCAAAIAAANAEQLLQDSAYLAANPELKIQCRCLAERRETAAAAITAAITSYLESESVKLSQNPELAAALRCKAEVAAAARAKLLHDSAFLAANPELLAHCRCATVH